MSDQTLQRAHSLTDSKPALPWLAGAGVYVMLLALAPRLLADPDTYSHTALGRWILEHHAVPTVDPFSLTMRGEPWVAFEWLSQVVFAAAHSLGGWPAVATLGAAMAALSFGLLMRFLLREWPPVPALIAALIAFVLASPHILARPHILALPIMVAFVASMIRAADQKSAPPWHMIPLMVLWANLHGSFTFGLAMIGAVALDALWNAAPTERLRVVRQWALFGVLALTAACINPYGPEMIVVTFRTIALGHALSTITEWRPQDFTHIGPFEIVMLACFGAALYRGVKLPLLRLVMVFGLFHLALSQSRHADLLGLLAPLFLARPLAEQFGLSAARAVNEWRMPAWAPAAVGLLLVAATGLATARNDIAPAAAITPDKAVQSLDLAKAGPILNDYDFGGYLDFVGIAPFIDGRGELYGSDFALRYNRAVNLQDVPGFLRLLDEYKFTTTLLSPGTPAIGLLDRLPNWQRVYADNVAIVHRRRGLTPGQ
ncbi:MAG: hypothetical protein ABI830_13165 [Pseudolabrys sp.]